MRHVFRAAALLTLVVAGPAWSQTAIEIKKDLFPKYKKAQAEGRTSARQARSTTRATRP
jgi:hypothetical protein